MGNFPNEPMLYVILDRDVAGGRHYVEMAQEVIRGGADVIQLRDKRLFAPRNPAYTPLLAHRGSLEELVKFTTASPKRGCAWQRPKKAQPYNAPRKFIEMGRGLREFTRKARVLFIVNDRADLAVALEADGVHLGQDDLPIEVARSIMGPEKIIGRTAHSISEAQEAQRQGADYVSVGPIFPTSVKPELRPVGLGIIRQAKEVLQVPFVAIGGINKANLRQVLDAGAQRVAVVRASLAGKDIAKATRELKDLITDCQSPIDNCQRQ